MNIAITAGAKTRNWRGVVLDCKPVKMRNGGFQTSWVCGFCTEFGAKDQVKGFVSGKGGSWDGVARYWFVPLEGRNMGQILESFWMLAQEGIAEFGDSMQMGGVHISVEAALAADQLKKVRGWLEKKAKVVSSGLTVVSSGNAVAALPTVRNVVKEEYEDEDGRIQYVRYKGLAEGSNEYLYPHDPGDPTDIYDIQSGFDSEGKQWWWRSGELAIANSFRPYDNGGWH